MSSCALGPCDDSTQAGGRGCYLCDTIGRLPQPRTLLEQQGKYAVPVAKDPAREPQTKKRTRKALDGYGLRRKA